MKISRKKFLSWNKRSLTNLKLRIIKNNLKKMQKILVESAFTTKIPPKIL